MDSQVLQVLKDQFEKKPLAYNLSVSEWEDWFTLKGFPKFGAKQVYEWLFHHQVLDPSKFTNLSQKVRDEIQKDFDFSLISVHSRLASQDGSQKLLLQTEDNLLIEMVIMPYEDRVTLCLSSQCGCKMGCTFCQTGKMGFKRNLLSGEILAQILLANSFLKHQDGRKVSNVVFMGMGEPLDNYDEVIKACRVMIDKKGLGLSKAKVTISTSGLVPEIYRLGRELPVRLAISLHSADDISRSKMMPINRKYPLEKLKKALIDYPAPARYGVTLEYVMIEGVNDTIADAKKLVKFIHGMKAKVNLIPINHFPGLKMKASVQESIDAFQSYLTDRSIPAPVRYSRAQDVSGGCGQLAAKAQNEIHQDPRALHKERRALLREKNV